MKISFSIPDSTSKADAFLMVVRGAIAIKRKSKADLAMVCGVSRSYFSEYINGYRPMPEGIRQVLEEELDLNATL